MNVKKLERYLRVNLLGLGPRLLKKRIYRAAVSQRLRNTGLDAPDDERKYRSKHVEQARNSKLILHSCILLVIFVNYIMMHGTMNVKSWYKLDSNSVGSAAEWHMLAYNRVEKRKQRKEQQEERDRPYHGWNGASACLSTLTGPSLAYSCTWRKYESGR